jgi:TetR/AcrR family transcriptional regulator
MPQKTIRTRLAQPKAIRIRDAEATKARLLSAATAEFSSKGYDGARVNVIAKNAGVNINLVYHYFGSKDGIYLAVLEQTYVLIRKHHRDMSLRALPPEEAMAQLVISTFRMFCETPEAIGILVSENVQQGRFVRSSKLVGGLYNNLLEFLKDALERGVKAGVFRRDVDPIELFITINGLGYFYLSNHHTLAAILHQDLMAPERIAQREAHILSVVMDYLRAR